MAYKKVNGIEVELTQRELDEVNLLRENFVNRDRTEEINSQIERMCPKPHDLLMMLWKSMDSGEIQKSSEFYDSIAAVLSTNSP